MWFFSVLSGREDFWPSYFREDGSTFSPNESHRGRGGAGANSDGRTCFWRSKTRFVGMNTSAFSWFLDVFGMQESPQIMKRFFLKKGLWHDFDHASLLQSKWAFPSLEVTKQRWHKRIHHSHSAKKSQISGHCFPYHHHHPFLSHFPGLLPACSKHDDLEDQLVYHGIYSCMFW